MGSNPALHEMYFLLCLGFPSNEDRAFPNACGMGWRCCAGAMCYGSGLVDAFSHSLWVLAAACLSAELSLIPVGSKHLPGANRSCCHKEALPPCYSWEAK